MARSANSQSGDPGAHVAQLAERVLGKDEVISSTLIMGSIMTKDAAPERVSLQENRTRFENEKKTDNNTRR